MMKHLKSLTIRQPVALTEAWVFMPCNLQFGILIHNDYGRAGLIHLHKKILYVDENLPEELNMEIDLICLKRLINTAYDYTGYISEKIDLRHEKNWVEINCKADWDHLARLTDEA
jgi:hypothetical protein